MRTKTKTKVKKSNNVANELESLEKMSNMKPFVWTDSRVRLFTQIYSSNFKTKNVDSSVFKYNNYVGRKLDEKIEQFKKDAVMVNKKIQLNDEKSMVLYKALKKAKNDINNEFSSDERNQINRLMNEIY